MRSLALVVREPVARPLGVQRRTVRQNRISQDNTNPYFKLQESDLNLQGQNHSGLCVDVSRVHDFHGNAANPSLNGTLRHADMYQSCALSPGTGED